MVGDLVIPNFKIGFLLNNNRLVHNNTHAQIGTWSSNLEVIYKNLPRKILWNSQGNFCNGDLFLAMLEPQSCLLK